MSVVFDLNALVNNFAPVSPMSLSVIWMERSELLIDVLNALTLYSLSK